MQLGPAWAALALGVALLYEHQALVQQLLARVDARVLLPLGLVLHDARRVVAVVHRLVPMLELPASLAVGLLGFNVKSRRGTRHRKP